MTESIVELMRKANVPGLSFENIISLPESDASILTGYGRPMSLGRSPYDEVAAWTMYDTIRNQDLFIATVSVKQHSPCQPLVTWQTAPSSVLR